MKVKTKLLERLLEMFLEAFQNSTLSKIDDRTINHIVKTRKCSNRCEDMTPVCLLKSDLKKFCARF